MQSHQNIRQGATNKKTKPENDDEKGTIEKSVAVADFYISIR